MLMLMEYRIAELKRITMLAPSAPHAVARLWVACNKRARGELAERRASREAKKPLLLNRRPLSVLGSC